MTCPALAAIRTTQTALLKSAVRRQSSRNDVWFNVVLDLDSVNYPTSGFLLLNKEIIFYNSRTQFAFTGVTRGAQNTIPAAHVDGDVIMYFEEG